MAAVLQGKALTLGYFSTAAQWVRLGVTTGSIAAIVGGYQAFTGVTAGRKNRRYQRALDDVTKMQ